MKQAVVFMGSCFAVQIMDLALLAAVVKDNRILSKRALKEFNALKNMMAKQQFKHCP